jgi:hypothetical protein
LKAGFSIFLYERSAKKTIIAGAIKNEIMVEGSILLLIVG